MKRLLLVFLLLMLPLCVTAEVLYASPGGLSLTGALALCTDGDVIELADGVYAEPVESFPLTIDRQVTLRAAQGASPVIDAPAFKAAFRVEADGVTLTGLDVRFRRTGIYAIGHDMTVEKCRISLAEEDWRTSSCGMWCGGIYRMTIRDCEFSGCGVALAGPPLSESSKGKPLLTGLFEVGEDVAYFTSHRIENCRVNGKPLFYAVSQGTVMVPENAGEVICCDCDEIIARRVDVSDGSMGMVLAYNRNVTLEECRADRCGVFGIYVAKCDSGVLRDCTSVNTNHGLDIRASRNILLEECVAADCDQGLFFSLVYDSAMVDCQVSGTGQGYFLAAGCGNTLTGCVATDCENGFNLQKEGHVLMTSCIAEGCTVCGVRLDATPVAFAHNTLRDNWVAVMAYGDVSFDMADNLFENSACCALYLRDIGFSRFSGNRFTGSAQKSVQAVGCLGGSVWIANALDVPVDFSAAGDAFAMTR
ncbi:MAG: nitrous oxide reductase family maturation protein NosD [Aristaeellaceae bacterium]